MDLFYVGRATYLEDGFAFIEVGLDSSTDQHEAEEFTRLYSEHAFVRIEPHVVLSKLVENLE